MSLLDRFEQSMERLLEGTVGTVFRQTMQPAELGKRLQRAMEGKRRVSVGTTIVPNQYVVHLHPKDFAQFADYQQGLCRQMEAWLAEVATEQNYSVLDRIQVSLLEDESASRRTPRIDASITDMHQPRPAPMSRPQSRPSSVQQTEMFQPMRTGTHDLILRATSGLAVGQDFRLAEGSSTIGRSPGNTVVINSPDISRRHARFEYSSGQVRIYDLNSTNGTRVNGEAIRVSDVFPGDTITLGSQELRVVDASSSNSRRE
ncbi:MAG: FhaA domain-containing protein [Thermomicrobiales bacterium]